MAKFSGGKTSRGRKIKGEMDWDNIEGTGVDSVDVEQAIDKVVDPNSGLAPDIQGLIKGDIGQVETAATIEAQDSNLGVFADIRGESVGDTRQAIATDPALYEEAQAFDVGPVGQTGSQVGVGVGYQPSGSPSQVSPINAITNLQAKVDADPNDFMAREQLLGMLGDQHTDSKGKTEERLHAEAGGTRPGTFQFGKMSVEERLRRSGDSAAMGRRVRNTFNEMTFDMTEQEISALSEKVNRQKDGGTLLEPGSMNEVVNGVLSTYANVKEQGGRGPEAFADISLHAVAHSMLESEKRKAKAEDKKGFEGFEAEEEADVEAKHTSGSDAALGGMIAKNLGVKGSNVTDTAVGALAKDIVGRSFPEFFQKTAQGWEIKPEGKEALSELRFMTSVILPETQVTVRDAPLNAEETKDTKRRIKKNVYRRANKERAAKGEFGDQTFKADVVVTLSNIAYTNDIEFYDVVEQLVSVTDTNGEGNYVDKINKIHDDQNFGRGTINNRPDRKLVDGKEEFYLGNAIKDQVFNQTLDWARDRGNKPFFYDYSPSKNERFYVDQTVGNYQTDKLTRAGIQAAKAEVYDLNSEAEMLQLKAGIAKKFGHDKKGVNAAAAAFDREVGKWTEMFADMQGDGGRALIDMAHKEEGWASISAMKEGVKLKRALDAKGRFPAGVKPQFRSRFFTEVDGVANGLGHNALQSGDWKVARRTNLNPDVTGVEAGIGRTDEEGRVLEQDVYNLAGVGAEQAIIKGSNDLAKKAWNILFEGNNKLRNFAKKPLMIFGYGASWDKINKTVDVEVTKLLENSKDAKEAWDQTFGNDPKVLKDVADAFHTAFQTGIEANFEGIHELSKLLSGLATEAVAQGIDPKAVTVGGHTVLFGLDWSELEADKAFFDMGIKVSPKKKVLLPKGRVVKEDGSYDRLARPGEMRTPINPATEKPWVNPKTGKVWEVPAGGLKSATQAAVILTHNNDGANIGMSFMELSKNPDTNIGAQVFDGVLTTPKQAAKVSAQLNKDFVKINKDVSNLKRLMTSMLEQGFNFGANNQTRKLRQRIEALEVKREILLKQITAAKTKQFFWD